MPTWQAHSAESDQSTPSGAVWPWTTLSAQPCLSQYLDHLLYINIQKYIHNYIKHSNSKTFLAHPVSQIKVCLDDILRLLHYAKTHVMAHLTKGSQFVFLHEKKSKEKKKNTVPSSRLTLSRALIMLYSSFH